MGSFDPLHIGHVSIISRVINLETVDKIFIVTSPGNPWKKCPGASFLQRNQMIDLVIQNELKSESGKVFLFHGGEDDENIEIFKDSDGKFYSYKQLQLILNKYGTKEKKYYIIGGSDIKDSIKNWKNYEWIYKNFDFLMLERGGYVSKGEDLINVSSTDIRNKISAGMCTIPFLYPSTIDYIKSNKLYGYFRE